MSEASQISPRIAQYLPAWMTRTREQFLEAANKGELMLSEILQDHLWCELDRTYTTAEGIEVTFVSENELRMSYMGIHESSWKLGSHKGRGRKK